MRKESDRHRVVVIATQDVPVFELAIPCEVFGIDRQDLTPHWYEFELVAVRSGVSTSHGLSVPLGRGLTALGEADTVIVPACARIHTTAPAALLKALRAAHTRGARIASLCSGAFVLAQAGLLDGHQATTHWMHAGELATRYPLIQVDPTVLTSMTTCGPPQAAPPHWTCASNWYGAITGQRSLTTSPAGS